MNTTLSYIFGFQGWWTDLVAPATEPSALWATSCRRSASTARSWTKKETSSREWDDTPDDFGRIAAQAAQQVILNASGRPSVTCKYEEYAGREGDIVTGIIQQSDNRYTLLDLGKVEALFPRPSRPR